MKHLHGFKHYFGHTSRCNTEEQQNAGGFKSGYNTDLYTRMNPKLGMTAANALACH
jgi:hypothetical protein